MEEFPKSISKQCYLKIFKQGNNSFFEIKGPEEEIHFGFFCYIKNENKDILSVIINNYIDNKYFNNTIDISINNQSLTIELDNIIYKNKYYNISIIKINQIINDNKIEFIEIDDKIYEKESELYFCKESIYIIQCQNIKDISVSYGVIKEIHKGQIIYTGNINQNSKFSPIFNASNNKLIGFHKNIIKDYNRGIFFKSIINNTRYYNEIIILINIEKDDIGKDIYFLDNYKYIDKEKKIHYKHDNFKELNDINTELFINNKKIIFQKYFYPEKEGINGLHLIFNNNLTDCSYMFAGCGKIIDINFVSFDTKNVINMKYMFYECEKLTKLNLFSFDVKNVIDMSFIFNHCSNLKNLDLSSFNTKKVTNISCMFYNCTSLENLDLSYFNTKNVNTMRGIFYNCKNLKHLNGISNWETKNITNMSFVFYNCESLKNFPDISKWETKNVTQMDNMFQLCKTIPDISKWDTEKVVNMDSLFSFCNSLESLPDISKWNTKNVTNMRNMFYNCSSLQSLPDISKWISKMLLI